MDGLALDWARMGENLFRIGLAFALALPLGWERQSGRPHVGLRTFPVVAMAACGYALIVRTMPGADADAQARLLQGLLAGIGFIGGGAILKDGATVRGVSTAASIWNTGAIGAAVAYSREEIAIILSVANVLAMLALTPPSLRMKNGAENIGSAGEGPDR